MIGSYYKEIIKGIEGYPISNSKHLDRMIDNIYKDMAIQPFKPYHIPPLFPWTEESPAHIEANGLIYDGLSAGKWNSMIQAATSQSAKQLEEAKQLVDKPTISDEEAVKELFAKD